MSLLLNRILKLSARKDNARFFSSLPQSPYLLLGATDLRESPDGSNMKHVFFDPTKEKKVSTKEKHVPKEFTEQPLLGASQGLFAFLKYKDLTLNLTDLYNPWVSSPRFISLPPIGSRPTTHMTKLCLSTSDPVQNDYSVAAKFNEYHISIYSPCRATMWTHIETHQSLLPACDLMYSKRDKTFYITSSNGPYIASVDLTNKELNFQHIRLRNLPKISGASWEILDQCFMTKHLVESPSSEHFFIKWYTQCIHKEDNDGGLEFIHCKTKRFMVFREDAKSKEFCYTEDIGDICIFLSKSEAFCLSASMYPGLKPNSIYYIGPRSGYYNLASGTDHTFGPLDPLGKSSLIRIPFWIHPTNPIA